MDAPITKLVVPMLEMRTSRPAVVVVGLGKVRVWPAVVWLTVKVVWVSTVAAAVPIEPPVAKLVRAKDVLRVEPGLIKPAFRVVAWVTVKEPATVLRTPVLEIVSAEALAVPMFIVTALLVSNVLACRLVATPVPLMLKLLLACCTVPFWIKPALVRPPSFSELKAWGTDVNWTLGVISASVPTFMPR